MSVTTDSSAASSLVDLPNEIAEARTWAHDFAEKYVRPVGAEYDEKEETPWPVLREAAAAGLYSPEFALQSRDDATGLLMPVVAEELFWGDGGIGQALVGTYLPVYALFGAATEEQIHDWLPSFFGTPSEPAVAALCASEPGAGSDAAAIRTRAQFDQHTGEWVLNGVKTWASNGGIAGVHVVNAVTDPDLGARGHALFYIPPGTPGLRQGQKFRKHGIRASHTAEVLLEDVRIPADNVLGGKDQLEERLAAVREGRRVRVPAGMAIFERARPANGAMAIGIARAAYEHALEYATVREQFGRPIIENQAIAFMLADMATDIDAARLLVWRAASMAALERPFTRGEGSMAKLRASEVAVCTTERAIQILGGNGYTRDYPVERWARDAKIFTISEGTSEIQRLMISSAIAKRRIR
ncbi:acyl-CoA dehydrogenase family protein [Mycobacteroides chelonae]|jgi:acyl-CoA dehydrogenase|uniref:Acyl-CoA dehydrogenase n=1 Tax=Mycobacteroides chelonae TaxID=1774 RepID=A0AB73U0Q8_MYCCH|nr:acyl-CoA dehydrogenase family protein [Mycobacteroides chelonae]MEC4839427.1 acyl-CoA dehydrogenase family protein [Mycobacteroides chelonae]MEC4844462.1 acyl-CoA dehydrogenase family protein [Mycobacteroides chelonae]OLT83724.1 acyl-CoA dehydrogenase [Mycobacteroides chelonae]QDF70224.1 acyl-CoA dehydrogenase [Mycobacteroides chelonae]WED93693.1 acyl-CoA dehydrogenase family protein [Mycobacteroides chelonae]